MGKIRHEQVLYQIGYDALENTRGLVDDDAYVSASVTQRIDLGYCLPCTGDLSGKVIPICSLR
jgi:hypothetical protein